jgi:hypothetical protein
MSGRCLCGAVSFVVTGPLRDVLNCHCHRCRRFTGHHMAATNGRVDDVEIADSEALLRWYEVPEAAYGFCGRCGSSLFWRGAATPDRISISAGTLDPPTGLQTVEAWWTSEASDYHDRQHLPERATE